MQWVSKWYTSSVPGKFFLAFLQTKRNCRFFFGGVTTGLCFLFVVSLSYWHYSYESSGFFLLFVILAQTRVSLSDR